MSFYMMNNRLNNFAYKIDMGLGVFVLSGITDIFIALLTVLFHALRSAYNNPVNALKYE